MKKLFSLIGLSICLMLFTPEAKAQFSPGAGFKQFNFGLELGYASGLYAGMDFGVSDVITLGPRVAFLVDPGFGIYAGGSRTVLLPSFRVDYHYSHHIDPLPDELDLYGGVSLGVGYESVNYDNDIYDYNELTLQSFIQAGARWYFSETWGAHLEIKGGTSRANVSSIGLSARF